jgi:hypothetical protein
MATGNLLWNRPHEHGEPGWKRQEPFLGDNGFYHGLFYHVMDGFSTLLIQISSMFFTINSGYK